MKTLNVFARYFALIAMLILTATSLKSEYESCDPCPTVLLNKMPVVTISATHDYFTSSECIVITYSKLSHYACHFPPPISDYWEYVIDSIVVLGPCTGITEDEKMERATRSIMAYNAPWPLKPARIKTPTCIKQLQSSFNPDMTSFLPCKTDCCLLKFQATWDIYGGQIDTSEYAARFPDPLDCNDATTGQPQPECSLKCNEDVKPPVGDLLIPEFLPSPCVGFCDIINPNWYDIADKTLPNGDGTNVYMNTQYLRGSLGSNPCFSLSWFQIQNNKISLSPEDAIKELIRQVLFDIWTNHGNPSNITLNVSKCWKQPHPPAEVFIPCSIDDCCSIEFEINGTGTEATVVSTNNSGLTICSSPCDIDACGLFPFYTQYSLPKMGVINKHDYDLLQAKIMPNPNSGIFTLEYNTNSIGIYQIKISDILGVEVFQTNSTAIKGSNSVPLHLTNLPKGTYYLQILNNGRMVSNMKFINN